MIKKNSTSIQTMVWYRCMGNTENRYIKLLQWILEKIKRLRNQSVFTYLLPFFSQRKVLINDRCIYIFHDSRHDIIICCCLFYSNLSRLVKNLMNSKSPNVTDALSQELEIYLRIYNQSEEDFLNKISGIISNSVQPQDTLESYKEFQIHRFLQRYIPPFLMLIGLVGNVMSFFILRHKSMARHSTNVFLAALSIADLIVLFVGLLGLWISEVADVDFQNTSDFMCKFLSLLTYSSSQFSAWLILAVTVERYIVVCHALHASRWCSRERARKTVILLAVIFILINSHLIWTIGIRSDRGKTECEGLGEYEFLVRKVFPWIDAALYSTIPVIAISLFNILIIRQVLRATHSRKSLQHVPLNNMELKRRSKNKSSKLTIMLLTISFAFCVTTLPMNVVMIASYQISDSPKEMAKLWLVRTTAELLMYLNHSMNFFLYCATGQKFRSIVLRIVCRVSNFSDHSQHIYCSGGYNGNVSGGCIHRKEPESVNNDVTTNQVTSLWLVTCAIYILTRWTVMICCFFFSFIYVFCIHCTYRMNVYYQKLDSINYKKH